MNYKHSSNFFIALCGSFESHPCPSSNEGPKTRHCAPEKSVASFAISTEDGLFNCNTLSSSSCLPTPQDVGPYLQQVQICNINGAALIYRRRRSSLRFSRQVIPPLLNIQPAEPWLTLFHLDVLNPKGAQS